MFSESCNDRDNTTGIGDNTAGIGDNAVGIVDHTAEIVNIAAKVIPCWTPSWLENVPGR